MKVFSLISLFFVLGAQAQEKDLVAQLLALKPGTSLEFSTKNVTLYTDHAQKTKAPFMNGQATVTFSLTKEVDLKTNAVVKHEKDDFTYSEQGIMPLKEKVTQLEEFKGQIHKDFIPTQFGFKTLVMNNWFTEDALSHVRELKIIANQISQTEVITSFVKLNEKHTEIKYVRLTLHTKNNKGKDDFRTWDLEGPFTLTEKKIP